MLRTCEAYDFTLVDQFDQFDGEPLRIPCRIEITSRRDAPDVDPCNPSIGATTDGRLSMLVRSVITDRIADLLHGKPLGGPLLDSGVTEHAPELIAVWAYWLACDQSRYEREHGGWLLTVESARVVIGDRWSVEYAPTSDTVAMFGQRSVDR